jgi:hypothetical protein
MRSLKADEEAELLPEAERLLRDWASSAPE